MASFGLRPDLLVAGGHGGFEGLAGFAGQSPLLERGTQTGQMSRVGGPQPPEIAKHGDRLIGLAVLRQRMGQLVGCVGAHCPRGRVKPNRLVASGQFSEHFCQHVIDPHVAGMTLLRGS